MFQVTQKADRLLESRKGQSRLQDRRTGIGESPRTVQPSPRGVALVSPKKSLQILRALGPAPSHGAQVNPGWPAASHPRYPSPGCGQDKAEGSASPAVNEKELAGRSSSLLSSAAACPEADSETSGRGGGRAASHRPQQSKGGNAAHAFASRPRWKSQKPGPKCHHIAKSWPIYSTKPYVQGSYWARGYFRLLGPSTGNCR